jgi:hypothetical protein
MTLENPSLWISPPYCVDITFDQLVSFVRMGDLLDTTPSPVKLTFQASRFERKSRWAISDAHWLKDSAQTESDLGDIEFEDKARGFIVAHMVRTDIKFLRQAVGRISATSFIIPRILWFQVFVVDLQWRTQLLSLQNAF